MQDNSRLAHLLELADKGPALRTALVEELAELLTCWPGDCPQEMQSACEALLARAAREVDAAVLTLLRLRLAGHPALAARVLPNAVPTEASTALPTVNLAPTLIEMARAGIDVRARLAEALHLSGPRVEEILASDHGLALLCKGLDLPRTVFSSLAMLMSGEGDIAQCYARLDGYDAVTAGDAARMLTLARNRDSLRPAAA